MYAGYSWRGRSKGTAAANAAPDDLGSEMREVMWFSPDQSSAEGRWFWGEYQEFGFDVKLRRPSADPTLIGVDRTALKTGSQGNRVRLIAESLPAQVAAADLDFGTGVTVRRIVSHTRYGNRGGSGRSGRCSVRANAILLSGAACCRDAIAVYDRIDYIKVTPDTALAHLGSEPHPKGYQQFEAMAYQRGADGKPHTADDVELGPIDVNLVGGRILLDVWRR